MAGVPEGDYEDKVADGLLGCRVVIRQVLPTLGMTSCFIPWGQMDRIRHDVTFRSSPGDGTS